MSRTYHTPSLRSFNLARGLARVSSQGASRSIVYNGIMFKQWYSSISVWLDIAPQRIFTTSWSCQSAGQSDDRWLSPAHSEILMRIRRRSAKGYLTTFEYKTASEANARDHTLRRVAQDNNVGILYWS